ncbi:MAG: dephospho-CoA kinase [Actinobacteria bacterium]|nr:dephospho-CoA kinase [Actinomycetota bacterium]
MAKKVYIITGPIGSGKSTAIKYLNDKGYKTVDLDKISNQILTSKQSINFLKEEFPTSLVNNVIDRELLAKIVFKNKDKLMILENYLHPKVLHELQNIIQNTNEELFIEVSAPKNIYKDFDCIVIFSDEETRIRRLLNRGMDNEDILNRMANQKDDEWWKSLGLVIHNKDFNDLQIELDNLLNHNS